MGNRHIDENVKRRLYAESMGRCMNPDCECELFVFDGDMIEKAHIDAYCDTEDNSFDNLVVLCPNCHTKFDKNHAFTQDEVLGWKQKRREKLEKMFSKKFSTFDELKREVAPILTENKNIYENYFLNNEKELWDKFEYKVLSNNKKLKMLLEANINLIQRHRNESYSNLACVRLFLLHIDEFESTRTDEEKFRRILFPSEINSMFGVASVQDFILPSTESLEDLIEKLKTKEIFHSVSLGVVRPYIQMYDNEKIERVYLDDTPRIRQLYNDYDCFKGANVRIESLNFALKYIRSRKIGYRFISETNLREIIINDTKMIFVYEYCLSQSFLMQLAPEENTIIVNLYDWNKDCSISTSAYEQADKMNVTLLTMGAFYGYINKIKNQ